jgi:plasmid replication initiation protein
MRLPWVDTKVIIDDVFMFYVRAFVAAEAVCHDSRLGAWSHQSSCNIYSLNGRGTFIRQLTWLSNVRAWEDLQISAKEIRQRVEPAAERVEYFDDGVYIVLDSRPLTMAEAKEKTLAANLALYPEIAPIIPSLRAIYADE